MGLWGSIKRFAKKVARHVVKLVVTVVHNIIPNGLDLLLGFLAWPQKHMRIHIFVLKDPDTGKPLINETQLDEPIAYAKTAFKDSFNVKIHKYSSTWVENIMEDAPADALKPGCGSTLLGQEFGAAGRFYARHLAGWNAIPITLTYPITVFVVKDVIGKKGCSLGPLTDYVVIDPEGVGSISTLAHELAHACNLWHSNSRSNLMFHNSERGNKSKWFQRNLLRSCRHVNYY